MGSVWKHIAGNSTLLLVARIISKFVTVAVTVLIARYLGKEIFGVYSTMLAITTLVSSFADFGLVLPTIRSISKSSSSISSVVSGTFSARAFWSVITLVVIVVFGLLFHLSISLIILFALSSVFDITATALIRSFEGKQEFKTITVYNLLERASFGVLVLGGLLLAGTLYAIAIGYIISYSLMLLVAYFIFKKKNGKLWFTFSFSSVGKYSLEGLPFFVSIVFSTLYYKADTIILSMFRSASEVGVYNAAARVADAPTFIPLVIMTSIFPTLTRYYHDKNEMFVTVLNRSFFVIAGLGLLFTGLLYVFAPIIIHLLYSQDYQDSIGILRITSLMLLFYFINALLSQGLIAIHKEMTFTGIMIFCAVATCIANWFFIPRYGGAGAAWVRVCIEATATILGLFFLFRSSRFNNVTHSSFPEETLDNSTAIL